ncbi:MAG: sigma-70 family RNA polymerase sigma factor [Deltaproteobacteria bacterium]|nr:sigma-70 family RNA polymerase sigma factor [Deltaproteobacteria bacterium]
MHQTINNILIEAQQAFPLVRFDASMLARHRDRLAQAEAAQFDTADAAPEEPGAPAPAGELEADALADTSPGEMRLERGMPDPAFAKDWALAAACVDGDPEAIASVERTALREVPQFIKRIDASPTFADELVQVLRERLFVRSPGGGPPRMASYSARGPLGGWIRVISVRLALELKRKESAAAPEHAADRLVDLALGPEDEAAKNEHSAAAQVALRTALSLLSSRQRNLLRLRFAEGWSPEDLGKTYGVHRGTIARWIQEAREHVKVIMARELAKILGFSEDEMPSVMRAVESRLELTFSMLKG